MHVDDAAVERLEERSGVDPVVAGVDDELDVMSLEEVAHRRVALLGRLEGLLRQLAKRDAPLPRELGGHARRAVGRHRHDVESTLDQVAQVGATTGDADAEPQRISTRSGPVCLINSPTTVPSSGTSPRSSTRIMPRPMLKVRYISSSAIRPRRRMTSKIGGTF